MPSRSLNPNQAEFARLLASGLSGADAYLQAYPGNYTRQAAAAKAHRLRKHPLIAGAHAQRAAADIAAIDAAAARYAITAERVADAMARLAFTDINQVAEWRTVTDGKRKVQVMRLKDDSAIDAAAMAAISEIRRDAGGALTVKLYSKREALMDIARLKGWIADKPIDQRNLVVLKVER